jgi:hypothetical protein
MSNIKLDVPNIKVLIRQEGETKILVREDGHTRVILHPDGEIKVVLTQPDTTSIVTGSFYSFAENSLYSVSSSYALTASYVSGAASDWDTLANKPEGLVSSSTQAIDWTVASSSVAISSSYALTASYAENAPSLPEGLVSASSQIILQDTTGNLSASRIEGTVQTAVSASYIPSSSLPAGLVSSSTQASSWTVASSSQAITASYARNADLLDGLNSTAFATTGSNVFSGSQTVTGTIITDADTLAVTGSILVSGSMEINTVITGSIQQALTASYIDGGYY